MSSIPEPTPTPFDNMETTSGFRMSAPSSSTERGAPHNNPTFNGGDQTADSHPDIISPGTDHPILLTAREMPEECREVREAVETIMRYNSMPRQHRGWYCAALKFVQHPEFPRVDPSRRAFVETLPPRVYVLYPFMMNKVIRSKDIIMAYERSEREREREALEQGYDTEMIDSARTLVSVKYAGQESELDRLSQGSSDTCTATTNTAPSSSGDKRSSRTSTELFDDSIVGGDNNVVNGERGGKRRKTSDLNDVEYNSSDRKWHASVNTYIAQQETADQDLENQGNFAAQKLAHNPGQTIKAAGAQRELDVDLIMWVTLIYIDFSCDLLTADRAQQLEKTRKRREDEKEQKKAEQEAKRVARAAQRKIERRAKAKGIGRCPACKKRVSGLGPRHCPSCEHRSSALQAPRCVASGQTVQGATVAPPSVYT